MTKSRGVGRGRKPGARAEAMAQGLGVYDGAACRRCGGVERYTSNGGCVACQNKRPRDLIKDKLGAMEARDAAFMVGRVKYHSPNVCEKCGDTERYVSNASCVTCSKARTLNVRAVRAAMWHSDTSPIMWINEPPSPETAPLYAMCPALAAYGGQWHCVYTDAQHLSPGHRIYPGQDVFKRPAALQMMLNDRTHPGHKIAQHLSPAYYAALSMFNNKVCRRQPYE